MQKINFKNGIVLLTLLMFVLFVGLFTVNETEIDAQTSTNELTGYAWSSNIGWISFNCSNADECGTSDYKVILDDNKNLTGYAWSSNAGWLQFGNLSGFPSGNGTSATNARIVGNEIVGWAKFLAGTQEDDGWDGWVSFDGSGYGVEVLTTESEDASVTGYAWGDDVVGWIDFNLNTDGVEIIDFNQELDLYCDVSPVSGSSVNPPEITVFTFEAQAGGGTGSYTYTWEISDGLGGFDTQSESSDILVIDFPDLAEDSYNATNPYVKVSVDDGDDTINEITCSFTINNSPDTSGAAKFTNDFKLSPKIVPNFDSDCNAEWTAVNVSSCSIIKVRDESVHGTYNSSDGINNSESNIQLKPNIEYKLQCTDITPGANTIESDPERCFVNPGFSE
jgi:hypothetical protein